MKILQKKSTAEIPPINGAVVDTKNIQDKITNAPSLRLTNEMIEDKIMDTRNVQDKHSNTYSCAIVDDLINENKIKTKEVRVTTTTQGVINVTSFGLPNNARIINTIITGEQTDELYFVPYNWYATNGGSNTGVIAFSLTDNSRYANKLVKVIISYIE